MAETIARISSWVNHLVSARTRHAVHSPFVYDLIEHVLRPDAELPGFTAIEQLRDDLLESEQTIRVNDLGAGSRRLPPGGMVFDLPIRRVSEMAATSLKSPKHARMLHRLAQWADARQVLELGTSFGISTLYLAHGAANGTVDTIEGCPQTFRIAQHHFERMRCTNVRAHLGSFRNKLPEVLRRADRLDLVFIDGHHLKAPTLDYFEQCLDHAHNGTVFVFDDIHWSRGMEEAWSTVQEHARVSVSIDLYQMGLVFLRGEQPRQRFRLRY